MAVGYAASMDVHDTATNEARPFASLIEGAEDFGAIPQKAGGMSGIYMGNDVVMTQLWTGHSFLASTRDMIVTPHVINLGMAEPHNSRLLVSLISPGDVVVDIGANTGYYSVLGAWRAFPGGKLWAFEPNPTAYALMSDNLSNNGFGGMASRHRLALSNRQGEAALRVFPGYEATSTIRDVSDAFVEHTERETGRASHEVTVPVDTLDNIMRDCPGIDFIKMDAEGHEPEIIDGARAILARSKNLKMLMEFVPPIMDAGKARAMLGTLRGLGLRIYRFDNDATVTRYDDDDELMKFNFSDLFLTRS
ncbi:FkbM family methyltransferase [Sphingopyxis panaciterrae]